MEDDNLYNRTFKYLRNLLQDSANGIKTLSRPPVPVGVLECLHQGDSFYLYESHDMPRASIFPTSHRFLCTNNETSCKAEFITCKIGHLNYESVATKTSLWVNREHNHLPQHVSLSDNFLGANKFSKILPIVLLNIFCRDTTSVSEELMLK